MLFDEAIPVSLPQNKTRALFLFDFSCSQIFRKVFKFLGSLFHARLKGNDSKLTQKIKAFAQ